MAVSNAEEGKEWTTAKLRKKFVRPFKVYAAQNDTSMTAVFEEALRFFAAREGINLPEDNAQKKAS